MTRQRPETMPETLKVLPLEAVNSPERRAGRPRKLKMPPLPNLQMGELEQKWFTFFVSAFQSEYPDLTDTDMILLQLAGIEYIKYLRVAAQELETGQVISMARQHPGTNMRALLDQLSVTRKARQGSNKNPEAEKNEKKLLDFLSAGG